MPISDDAATQFSRASFELLAIVLHDLKQSAANARNAGSLIRHYLERDVLDHQKVVQLVNDMELSLRDLIEGMDNVREFSRSCFAAEPNQVGSVGEIERQVDHVIGMINGPRRAIRRLSSDGSSNMYSFCPTPLRYCLANLLLIGISSRLASSLVEVAVIPDEDHLTIEISNATSRPAVDRIERSEESRLVVCRELCRVHNMRLSFQIVNQGISAKMRAVLQIPRAPNEKSDAG